jgi:tRNA pseudouridine55 synthase
MPILDKHIVSKASTNCKIDYLEGAVFLVDKPLDWTSFDVVNKIKYKLRHTLGVKKIKVGHAGTLDPLATGLLLVCTGKLTKEIDSLQVQKKKYSGHIMLGATTDTYDREFEPNAYYPVEHIDASLIETQMKNFIGEIEQVPPIYSAVKVNGQTAYSLARRGKDVELKSRSVTIYDLNINPENIPELYFTCECSKGTYIRSLANDFGKALQSGAYLSSLRRDGIGDFHVNQALHIDEVIAFIEASTLNVDIQSDKG